MLAPYDTAREGVWRQGGQHVHKDATWVGRSTGQQKSLTRGVDRKEQLRKCGGQAAEIKQAGSTHHVLHGLTY